MQLHEIHFLKIRFYNKFKNSKKLQVSLKSSAVQIHQISVPHWKNQRIKSARLQFLSVNSKGNRQVEDRWVCFNQVSHWSNPVLSVNPRPINWNTNHRDNSSSVSVFPKRSKLTSSLPPALPRSKKDDIISQTNILIVFIWLDLSQQEYRKPFNWYWAGSSKVTYNVEVGWICRTRVSVHPGRDACLHVNDSSSHAVDVCFCCVASAKDNFRAHVNLWEIVKKKKKD